MHGNWRVWGGGGGRFQAAQVELGLAVNGKGNDYYSGVAGYLSNSKTAEKNSLTDLMKTMIFGCFHDTANLVITDRDTWKMKDLNIYSTFLSLLNKVVFKLSGTTHLHLCTALYHAHRKMFVIHQSIKSCVCKIASCLMTSMIKFDTHIHGPFVITRHASQCNGWHWQQLQTVQDWLI